MPTTFKDEVQKLYKQLLCCINLEPNDDQLTYEEYDMFTDMKNLKRSIQAAGYHKQKQKKKE